MEQNASPFFRFPEKFRFPPVYRPMTSETFSTSSPRFFRARPIMLFLPGRFFLAQHMNTVLPTIRPALIPLINAEVDIAFPPNRFFSQLVCPAQAQLPIFLTETAKKYKKGQGRAVKRLYAPGLSGHVTEPGKPSCRADPFKGRADGQAGTPAKIPHRPPVPASLCWPESISGCSSPCGWPRLPPHRGHTGG